VVGSGELIVTTSLGAKAGFALLGVILVSCVIKVGVQLEFGRHSICHGVPSFQAWNAGRGPRLLGLHWSVYAGLLYIISNLFGQAGVVGGAAQVAAYAFPDIGDKAWAIPLAIILSLLVFHGRYGPVELIATLLNVLFVLTIIISLVALQRTDDAVSVADIGSGFSLRFPAGTLGLALAAFGITGVGSGEIFAYPYWCVEKGYGAWTGRQDGSPQWAARAKGWIRVMTIDAVVSMVIYTVATVGFYILGAAVLHGRTGLADDSKLILQLSGILTEVLGTGGMAVFMIGAFFVLFSTAFSNTAAHSRLWADFFGISRLYDASKEANLRRWIAIMAWVLPALWALAYISIGKVLFLVALMGIANALFLVVVAYQALVYRFRYTDPLVKPTRRYDALLLGSVLAIVLLTGLILYQTYEKVTTEKEPPEPPAATRQETGVPK
jgi:Mn2+/Fe2+ NRAMP family transporter